jgi:peptidyl-prolyl cis-trans isomerase C
MSLLTVLRRLAPAAVLCLPLLSAAAEPVLAQSGNLSVDTADIRGDALRIPVETRAAALSEPRNVATLANNLLIRRKMAAEAEAAGLANDPAVQAAIRIARERVLSDALIARLDASQKPAAAVIDRLAEAAYKGKPDRFQRPPQTHARHILVLGQTPESKAKAETLLQQLKAGAKFDELARTASQDPGSASKGGDLGFFSKGTMVPEFDAALDELKNPGELSGVVQSQFGYHIIKLEARRGAGIYSYEEVKDTLRAEAEQQAIAQLRQTKVQQIQDTIKLDNAAIEAFSKTNIPSVVRR